MNLRIALLGILLSGFFGVACLRAAAAPASRSGAMDLFRFPGRLERLRRSRWQWSAMAALMIVLRLQQQLPAVLEVMAAFQLLVFLALPAGGPSRRREGEALEHR